MSEPRWNDEQRESFDKVVEPVMQWINDNGNPHMKIIIDTTNAELLSGEMCHNTMKFVKD